ncbi:PASTA domain-containing protein [Parafrankia sp. FMc2]|uniref:PASTA domain-containing protein n=1 Tax=Parafrankia sp. FMc2 TaxID=3233196 RepID=UPI0034D69A47
MSTSGTPWQDARRAWDRLAGWHRDHSSSRHDLARPGAARPGPARPDGGVVGDDALAALTDIGTVRRLLDQVELDAVRAARRQRKSWAEIATRLGVSRQSAWERWRDLDDADRTADTPADASALPDVAPSLHLAAETVLGRALDEAAEDATATITGRAVGRLRRRSTIVPTVVGRSWEEARLRLSAASLIGVGPDPDSLPLTADGFDAGSVVQSQAPEPGARVPNGSLVRLRVGRGGGSAGVREPRRPAPSPMPARRAPLEPADDPAGGAVDRAVG